jgi:hypothetical protein
MPRLGYEATIPVFLRAKAVYALERAATVIVSLLSVHYIFSQSFSS